MVIVEPLRGTVLNRFLGRLGMTDRADMLIVLVAWQCHPELVEGSVETITAVADST